MRLTFALRKCEPREPSLRSGPAHAFVSPRMPNRISALWRAVVRHNILVLAVALFISFPVAAATPLLGSAQDFKLLATLGFQQAVDGAHPEGSGLNNYAWSMRW